jgi:hypothetical protein
MLATGASSPAAPRPGVKPPRTARPHAAHGSRLRSVKHTPTVSPSPARARSNESEPDSPHRVNHGHLHHIGQSRVEEHQVAVGGANPADCTPNHNCGSHEKGHKHGPGCGHEAVPHGDHVDYLVAGHLHHPHGDHCDDHGKLHTA